MAAAPSPSVAYVVSRWGEPTQTFVRREAGAVVRGGCRVTALSLKRPRPTDVEVDVHCLRPPAVVAGMARALARHPGRCLRVLATVVRHSAPRNVVRQLAAACVGLAWVGTGAVGHDHLHAQFGWVAATAAWAAATVARKPYSVMLHAFEVHNRRYVDGFTPVPLRGAARVFCESHRDRRMLAERWGVEAAIVRLGIPAEWLEATGADRDPWLIVSVGALRPKKGHPVLVEAVAAADPAWHLVICGEGPLRPELERLIADRRLGDRVRLAGAQSEAEVRGWLQRAAVCCLASVETPEGDRDGTPMALIEGMASGAAVVSTDVGAIGELIAGAGLVVPSGDAAALSAAIDELRDPVLRARLGAAGRRRVAEEFVADAAAVPVVELVRRSAVDGLTAAR